MGSQEAARAVSGGGSAGQQMMKSLSLLALVAGAIAQKPARIGADGKPLLNRPDIEECMKKKSCPPRLLHRQFQGNNSSSLSSLHLSLRHRPSSPANSALPRVSLQDLCGRCLSDLRLSALSRRGTPSPPFSPTSGCPSSKAHHLN